MKRTLLIIGIMLLAVCGFAQDGGRIEAYKIAYLTKKLNLSTEEAQKFWPVYNKYVAEVRQVRKDSKTQDEVEMEEEIVNIRKKYKTEFSQALSADRVNQFYKYEKEFNNTVFKELRDRQRGKPDKNEL